MATIINPKPWRPTEVDWIVMQELEQKLGLTFQNVIRLALRRLAEFEGLKIPEQSVRKGNRLNSRARSSNG